MHSRNPTRGFLFKSFTAISLFLTISFLGVPGACSSQTNTRDASGMTRQYTELITSLDKTIRAEKESIAKLKERLDRLEELRIVFEKELDAYQLQYSTFGTMLSQGATDEDLKRARAELISTILSISNRLDKLSESRTDIALLQQEARSQYDLNEEQLKKLKSGTPDTPIAEAVISRYEDIKALLSEKLEMIASAEEKYGEAIRRFEEKRQSFDALIEKFDREIEESEKKELFTKKEYFSFPALKEIPAELASLAEQLRILITPAFWLGLLESSWKLGQMLLVTALLLYGLTQFFLFKLRKLCLLVRNNFADRRPWLCLALDLFQSSLALLGTVLFLYLYAEVKDLFAASPFSAVFFDILLIWLFTRWFADFLILWKHTRSPAIPLILSRRLRLFIQACRFLGIIYVVLQWTLGSTGSLLFAYRLILEVSLILWSVSFLKTLRHPSVQSLGEELQFPFRHKTLLRIFLYALAFGGLTLELVGYGQLALQWYISWGRTAVMLLWAGLLFLVIREWDRSITTVPISERKGSHHVRWIGVRLMWLFWLFGFITFLLIAWGAKRAVLLTFFKILNKTVQFGEIRFNLLGIVLAFLILICTLAATRFWKQFLRERILAGSGLELGLQESATTITVYAIWVFGILAAARSLGLSSTSLAVGFGALGIGLGFGLQNIFNNFVSGLILLFERPIQVGEIIEMGGTWGTVRRINFRSTIVQTFDNASLIIPNAEFISNKLTNWSFKDPRVRSRVTVGVAYGSDVELVRDTLIEIASNHPHVLKYPHPDVVFSDFADSALIFVLRFWSMLDHFYKTETDIRFEINRIFRERKIEIAFPQRDVHIRSFVKNDDPVKKSEREEKKKSDT